MLGGVEWNGPAYHPGTGTLITPAVDWCYLFTLFQPDEVRYVEGQLYMGGTFEPAGDATGWITSVDAGSGVVRWRYHSERPVVAVQPEVMPHHLVAVVPCRLHDMDQAHSSREV